MVNRERGHTFMGLMIAMAVLTIIGGAAVTGGNAHLKTIGRAFDEHRLAEAAAARLEALAADDAVLVAGERSFPAGAGMTGAERVTEVRPGLFEVRVTVAKDGVPPVTLTTLEARGGGR
jgi:hypothetical protein